ncbi:helix-turn-helix domain-containing protein [Paenibacillus sp. 5J-6]|uniref:Helix-turn-helix domain-containing protein n=1 Tax=Paenibacillus silvestris TaxID=2606219 RepID=A0A6L8USH6_9BACL|nr:AraC family transcriptional regulator [Paenibacillus silvestris]MZQ81038.1 helix-turn-helix domain-containing protein [Paenibacillus silvestris]
MTLKIHEYRDTLARSIERLTNYENGIHPTPIPSLFLFRENQVTEPKHGVHSRSICFVFQGQKEVLLSQERYRYSTAEYLVASVQLPVISQITEASPEAPYLALKLEFTPEQVLEVIKESKIQVASLEQVRRGLFISEVDVPLLDAVMRLVQLLDNPADIPLFASMIIKEILYRVLQGKQGGMLTQIAVEGGGAFRIKAVIDYIKEYYKQPVRIEELAEQANMSIPTLHRHFKEVTAMTPIQFQKQLRLQAARQILLSESSNAADVAFQVGYESPSQFSREYSRMFGLSPIQDIKRLRLLEG